MRVVATAGHVDHGKSSLVLALTGVDPDRFPEEKERGLTIDLGFAFSTLPSGEVVGFVDVPGHVKFVKNMLAGVGAIEVALLVVAANEGWMPQTEEHVRILELLGVEHGLIALTKSTLVDGDTLELARLDLDEHTAGTALARWPVVVTDSVAGIGIDHIRTTLDDVLTRAPAATDRDRPRLWVDRVFVARGAGTIVTGTLVDGSFAVDDDVFVEPGSRPARVRGIESHHERLTRIGPGSRVALNLSGIDHDDVRRGDAIVRAHQWSTVSTVDVALHLLDGERVNRRGMFDVHVGSGQHRASVRVLDGDTRWARLRFDTALPLVPGDRLVLRSSARQTTVGGAEVLDIAPARRVRDALARFDLPLGERLLATRPWLDLDEIERLAGLSHPEAEALAAGLVEQGAALPIGTWFVATAEAARVVDDSRDAVRRHHEHDPTAQGMDLQALASAVGIERAQLRAALATSTDLTIERDIVRDVDHRGGAAHEDGRRLLDALEATPFAPPTPSDVGVGAATARALVRDGLALEIDGVLFAASAIDDARRRVGNAVVERGTLTVAEIRDLLGSTRKYVLPIVNQLDREGVTRRRGDTRIPGPRATP